jgi:hypothetical protein
MRISNYPPSFFIPVLFIPVLFIPILLLKMGAVIKIVATLFCFLLTNYYILF